MQNVLMVATVLISETVSFVNVDTKRTPIPKFYVTHHPLIVYVLHSITIFLDIYRNERTSHYDVYPSLIDIELSSTQWRFITIQNIFVILSNYQLFLHV